MSERSGLRGRLRALLRDFGSAGANQRPLCEVRYTVLDAEMTGLDFEHDELIAVGAVRMLGPRIVLSETFYRLIRPAKSRWGASVPVHGIRPDDVATAPPAGEVLPAFFAFCTGTVLVGHGVDVDRLFLRRAAERAGVPFPQALWIDTGRVARWLLTRHGTFLEAAADRGRFSLEDLLAAYDIAPPARHHALADAFVTAQIWQRQLYELAAEGVRTVRDLRLAGLA
jgi:DNA polymerase-3 subunit epsilon